LINWFNRENQFFFERERTGGIRGWSLLEHILIKKQETNKGVQRKYKRRTEQVQETKKVRKKIRQITQDALAINRLKGSTFSSHEG